MSKKKEIRQRPGWNEYFMLQAILAASRSTCLRHNIGAVATKNKRTVATGYNGAAPGLKHCAEIGCIREKENIPSATMQERCRAVHAEENILTQASTTAVNILGATIYCTHSPCSICARKLISLKPDKIYYYFGYPDEQAKKDLREVGIELIQFEKTKKTEEIIKLLELKE